MLKAVFFLGIISAIIVPSYTEIVDFDLCEDVGEKYCNMKEVRVSPCKEATSKKPCGIKKGTNVSIEFDYVPLFAATKVFSMAYSETFIGDLPMPGMDKYACNFTKCPIKRGREGTYSNKLYMSRAFPSSSYTVKWWLWDAEHMDKDNKYIGCCFTIKIKLRS